MGNPGATLSAYRDMQSHARFILEAAKHGPLQALTDREFGAREQPMTVYPRPKRFRARVRFGPEDVRVDAKLGFHSVVPALAIVGWVLFGPHPRVTWKVLLLALIWPGVFIVLAVV